MGKHTPGPWMAECIGCTDGENPEDIYEVGTQHVRVCEYVAERDARLIAAAPDLLEACRAIYKMMDDEPFDFAIAGEILHSAIAKAESHAA